MKPRSEFLQIRNLIVTGFLILFLSWSSGAFSQTSVIGGLFDPASARIDAVYSAVSTDKDSVHVSSVSGFAASDTVLVHFAVGATFYASGGNVGNMTTAKNTGKYAIFIIDSIDVTGNIIILNSILSTATVPFTKLDPGEYGQIIKIPTYKRAVINSELTCNPYNPATGTGGIIVLLVKQGLVFNADINADGKGFPGAIPDVTPYAGTCSGVDPVTYAKYYFLSSAANYSASKGLGPVYTTCDTTRGRGPISLGGGGGNGKFSGGGGGGNGGEGGKGGFEAQSCGANDLGGLGGKAPGSLYYQSGGLGNNRINFGGGGGTSTQDPAAIPARIATAGGNGGGIVILVCDSLIGNGTARISARGQSVSAQSTAGAGGGGAGGAIVMHVNKFITNHPKPEVTGGDGGYVSSSAPEACGPGGGGGAGVIWYNGAAGTPGSSGQGITGGTAGKFNTSALGAIGGSFGISKNNLLIPIRGFLFNYIPDPDTACKHDTPKTINAPPPVGGTGSFTYNWLESTNGTVWVNAAGTRTNVNYTPLATDTISKYYKRAVFDSFIHDTSNIVRRVVLEVISNNVLVAPLHDTICYNSNAGTLTAGIPAGGNGIYSYYWERSNNNFTSFDTTGKAAAYPTPALTADTWYRRKIVSSACKSTSDITKITVLPLITNNLIDSSQEICTSRTPDLLTGKSPAGGAGPATYTYKWEKSTTGTWTSVGTAATYQPVALTANHQYRRIVFSGEANTCKDTSLAITVTVMPDISLNTVDPITQNILCSGLQAEILTATTPTGGNGSYNYYWQRDGLNQAGGLVATGFDPGILTATSVFRRVVTSGTNSDSLQRCHSVSNSRTISILEKITNNSISTPQTVWCQGKTPDDITGLLPLNGDGTYQYSWQSKTPAGIWSTPSGNTISFDTPLVTSSMDYRRIVKSGLNETCKDTSNVISIVMQDSILNNKINNDLDVFVCFDQDSLLQSASPALTGGDGSNYTYLWIQSSSRNGTYTDATEADKNNAEYLTEAIQNTRFYKRSVSSGDCFSQSLAVKVEPLPLPEPLALTVSLNQICYNKLDSLITVSIQSGELPYIVSYSDGQGFTDSRIFNTTSGKIKPGINNPPQTPGFIDYNFKFASIEDNRHCFAKQTLLAPFAAPLRVYATPSPERITAPETEVCSDNFKIEVTPSYGTPSWHLTNVQGISSTSGAASLDLLADFSSNDNASARIAYVEDIANCPSDSIIFDAVLYNTPDSVKNIYRLADNTNVVIGDTLIVFISDNQALSADPVVSGNAGWNIVSGGGGLSSATGISTEVTGLVQDDPAFLKYSITNGVCLPNEKIIKIVRKELLVYDGFSPNGDGVNDELWAVGLGDEEVDFKFQVFSSSGNFVREIKRKDIKEVDLINNQVVLWDGSTKMGGADNFIPDGTYYYVLVVTYHGENFNKRGYIIVKR
ncbi:MAG: gliding motility-associated C-terminal domain-containing protein [Bacteroidales bacterium]|nr:gliding motility-associated C-terminal domain-containing protein [Bacteroidales bacterium]